MDSMKDNFYGTFPLFAELMIGLIGAKIDDCRPYPNNTLNKQLDKKGIVYYEKALEYIEDGLYHSDFKPNELHRNFGSIFAQRAVHYMNNKDVAQVRRAVSKLNKSLHWNEYLDVDLQNFLSVLCIVDGHKEVTKRRRWEKFEDALEHVDAALSLLEKLEGRAFGIRCNLYHRKAICFHLLGDKKAVKKMISRVKGYGKDGEEMVKIVTDLWKRTKNSNKSVSKHFTRRGLERCCNPFCNEIEKTPKSFMVCSACRLVKYCSKTCQKKH